MCDTCNDVISSRESFLPLYTIFRENHRRMKRDTFTVVACKGTDVPSLTTTTT